MSSLSNHLKRLLAILLVVMFGALSLASCAVAPNPSSNKLQVVTSLNVWADIVHEIGGDLVEATPIIDQQNQDPHSYEATPQDELLLSKASVIVYGLNSTDMFMQKLISNLPEHSKGKVAPVVFGSNFIGCPTCDPHIWFSLDGVSQIAWKIAESLSAVDSRHETTYRANLKIFQEKIDAMKGAVAGFYNANEQKTFLAVEPIGSYLFESFGYTDVTPKSVVQATRNEVDFSALDLKKMQTMVENSEVTYLVFNRQVSSPQVQKLQSFADAQSNALQIEFSESLAKGDSWLAMMKRYIETIGKREELVFND